MAIRPRHRERHASGGVAGRSGKARGAAGRGDRVRRRRAARCACTTRARRRSFRRPSSSPTASRSARHGRRRRQGRAANGRAHDRGRAGPRAPRAGRLRVLVVALSALLVVTVGGVVVAYRLRPPADVALRREMVKVMEQQRAASDADRAALQQKLDELGGKRSTPAARAAAPRSRKRQPRRRLARRRAHAGSQEEGFCPRSPSTSDRLVTNAHCVAAAEDLRRAAARSSSCRTATPRHAPDRRAHAARARLRSRRRDHLARRRLAQGRRQAAARRSRWRRPPSTRRWRRAIRCSPTAFPGGSPTSARPRRPSSRAWSGASPPRRARRRRRRAAAHPALGVHLGRHVGQPHLRRARDTWWRSTPAATSRHSRGRASRRWRRATCRIQLRDADRSGRGAAERGDE